MNFKKLLVGTLSLSLFGVTTFSCGSGSSNELTIVHFDQTILGDTQKDLGVSIGIKKGNDEFKNKINAALSELTTEQRNQMMEEAIDRSNGDLTTSKYPVYQVPETTNGVIRVGLECDYAPFNWTDTKANEFNYPISGKSNQYAEGYDIQVARYLANRLNYSLEVVALDWEALIPALETEMVNVVIAGMTDTEERRQSIDFSDEYYVSELVLIVKKDSKYASATSLSSFEGAKIVSQINTVTDTVIETWKDEFKVTHLNPLDTFATCAIAVKNGTADAMTAELPVANSIVKGSK